MPDHHRQLSRRPLLHLRRCHQHRRNNTAPSSRCTACSSGTIFWLFGLTALHLRGMINQKKKTINDKSIIIININNSTATT